MIGVLMFTSLAAILVSLCAGAYMQATAAPAGSAEERRLRELREAYVRGDFGELPESVERLGLHVERALRAEPDPELLVGIPEPGGLPAADPVRALRTWEGHVGVGFVTAAEPDGTTCACPRCTAWVDAGEWTFPYCHQCYANVDGKCA